MAAANGEMAAGKSSAVRREKNRKQLLFEFDMQRDAHDAGETKWDYFIGDAYPPSTTALSRLSETTIRELEPESHNAGKVLFIRTIDTGIPAAGMHNIVEDKAGSVERLVLYNSPETIVAAQLIPKDVVFAIKEPYLEITPTGNSCLRVDHPSNLIRLNASDPSIPSELQTNEAKQKSALDWKATGNDFYKAGHYLAALDAFSEGLDVCGPEDSAVRRDLFRNRAIANTYIVRFAHAEADAQAAVIPSEESPDAQVSALNSKAYFRAGRAAYELQRFKEAQDYFKRALTLVPDDKDTQKQLDRIEARLAEQSKGEYNFKHMGHFVSKKHNRLDHADFLSNVEMRNAGTHGNGLFALRNIAAGELILCEKAYCVAFESDTGLPDLTVLDAHSHRQLAGTQASLFFSLVGRLQDSPEKAAKFFTVYDGGYPFKTPTEVIDDSVPVDAFRVQAIVQHNSFGCPNTRTTSKEARKQLNSSAGYPSTGLWMNAAYTNHSCNGNAMRSFIGDMMIMRATRDIAKGAEILMPYRLPTADNDLTQSELQNIWGFTCDCALCEAEEKSTSSQRQQRKRLLDEITALQTANPLTMQGPPKPKALAQVGKLYDKIESTYDLKAFEGMPRLALVIPGMWLCQVNVAKGQWEDAIKTGLAALRNLGYVLAVTEDAVRIERSHCLLVREAIDAAMFVALAYRSRKKAEVANQITAFAKELYTTLNGDLREMEELYNVG